MKVISIVNTKGGVGKSTLTCNLAVAAAQDNKNVLIIDGDGKQASSLAFRALREKDDITAISITTPTINKDIKKFSDFDIIFIDVGGRDSTISRSAIMAAAEGLLLIPVLPSNYDIWATEDTFKLLGEARAFIDIKAYAVFNQVLPNTNIKIVKEAKLALEEMSLEYNVPLLDQYLYSRVDYKSSVGEGKGVIEYNSKSKAALEVINLYEEIKLKLKEN